jgi:hypothetical protein
MPDTAETTTAEAQKPFSWFTAEVTSASVGDERRQQQTIEGGAKTVAAFLRAAADEIDPPIRMTRSRSTDPEAPKLPAEVLLKMGKCPCGHGPAEHGNRGCASCDVCKRSSGTVGAMIAEAG